MMENKQNHPPKLKRSMTAGQMEMISLGGAIGVGLFMDLHQLLNGQVHRFY